MRSILLRALFMLLAFSAGHASAWEAVPLLSYSSSSGVLFGGVITHNMIPPFSPFGFSAMAYVYTDGSFEAGPGFLVPAGSGLLSLDLSYRARREDRFFGWGNGGSNEDFETYSSEVGEASAAWSFSPLPGFVLTPGVICRHSTVYNRSQEGLWNSLPASEFGSRWTAGPSAEGRWLLPAPLHGYMTAAHRLQFGDGISYNRTDASLALFAPLGNSTVPAFRTVLSNHRGSASTPFPFMPSLGGSSGLRGYSDGRFMGDWALLCNVELRQRVLTLPVKDEEVISFSLVLFGDAGQVADRFGGLAMRSFHLDAGLGARMSVPGGATLRADFALSPEGPGIQMAIGELF